MGVEVRETEGMWVPQLVTVLVWIAHVGTVRRRVS
jgi:hypothetical protein